MCILRLVTQNEYFFKECQRIFGTLVIFTILVQEQMSTKNRSKPSIDSHLKPLSQCNEEKRVMDFKCNEGELWYCEPPF